MRIPRPNRSTWTSARARLADERRARRLAAVSARVLTPPPPAAFGSFGAGSYIVPPARVSMPESIHIGSRVIINEHSWLSLTDVVPGYSPRLTIGDGTVIDRLVHIACAGEIVIAEDVLLAERVLIGDTYHDYKDLDQPIVQQLVEPRRVVIARGAHVGLGAAIMPGVTVGEYALVGAGSVVTRDVPPRSVVVGNPARIARRFDEASGVWQDG